MDKSIFHATLKAMQDAGVARQYSHGWASGVLGNPALEPQRVTEAYTAGYEDGSNGVTDAFKTWVDQTPA